MGWKNFNDRLAWVMIPGLPTMWLACAVFGVSIPEVIQGTLIAGWTLMVQYYFRKAAPDGQ